MRLRQTLRGPRAKRIAPIAVGVRPAIGVLGFLVAPPILKAVLVKELSAKLRRPGEIRAIASTPAP